MVDNFKLPLNGGGGEQARETEKSGGLTDGFLVVFTGVNFNEAALANPLSLKKEGEEGVRDESEIGVFQSGLSEWGPAP